MPNKKAKQRKRKRLLLNAKLKHKGRTAIQIKNYKKKKDKYE